VSIGVPYYYRIYSLNIAGNSAYSTIIGPVQSGHNLAIPFDLVETELWSFNSGSPFKYDRSAIYFNPNDFNQVKSWTFEIQVSTTIAGSVYLYQSDGTTYNQIASIPVSASVTNYPYSIAFTPSFAANFTQFLVYTPSTSTAGQIKVHAARIIVTQLGAQKTAVSHPLLLGNSDKKAVDSNGTNVASDESSLISGWNQGNATNWVPFIYNSSNWAGLASTNAWYFTATYNNSGAYNTALTLYDETPGFQAPVSGANFSSAATGYTDTKAVAIQESTMSTLGGGHQYSYRMFVGNGTGYVYSARMYQRFDNVTRIRVPIRVGSRKVQASGTSYNFVENKQPLRASDFSPFVSTFVTFAQLNAGASAQYMDLMDCGTTVPYTSCTPFFGTSNFINVGAPYSYFSTYLDPNFLAGLYRGSNALLNAPSGGSITTNGAWIYFDIGP
jgi:hypothetical protein